MKTSLHHLKFVAPLLLLLLSLFNTSTVFGQTNTWDGSSSANWNTPANWSLNLVPTNAHDVVIPNGITATITVNTAAVCKTFTMNGGATANNVTISNGNSLTVSGAVSIGAGTGTGDDKLLNVGSAALSCTSINITATGNNNRSSGITLSTGTVTASGSITMGDVNDDFRFTGAGLLKVGGDMSGGTFTSSTGTVEYYGDGTGGTSATQSIAAYTYNNLKTSGSGIKSLAGNTTVNSILTVNSTTTLNLGTRTLGSPTSTILQCGATAGSIISGTGLLTLGGNITVNNVATGTDDTVISCPVALGATRTFSVADDGTAATDLTISGIVSGGGSGITKTGAGTMILSGMNTYTGATTVNNGILKAGVATQAFGQNSAVTLANTLGVLLDITGFNTTIGSLTGGGASGGNITLGAATLTIGSNNTSPAAYSGIISGTGGLLKTGTGTLTLSGTNTYTGATTINNGALSVSTIGNGGVAGNLGQATNAAANLVLGGGALEYTGATSSTDRNFILTAGTTSTIEITTNTLTVSGASTATTGGLTKIGAGSLVLTGTNLYTGNTNINEGILFNNGSLASAHFDVPLATGIFGGVFAGNGTAVGTTNLVNLINPTSKVAPGATWGSIGILTTGAFTFSGYPEYTFDISNATGTAGTGWDLLNCNGAINVNSSNFFPITVRVTGNPANFNHCNSYTWKIAQGTSVTGFNANEFTINTSLFTPTFSGTFSITNTGNDINLVYTPASITLTSAAGTNAQTKCINTAITNITYSTTGSVTGATFSGLPTGVTGNWASNTVTISGTPSVAGTFNYTVTLTGTGGCSITANGSITVTPNNTITLSSAVGTDAQTKCLNTAITNITYSTTGATGATISGLPAGITGNWAANVYTISGTPSASGTFNYTITLTGGCGNITKTGTIIVRTNFNPGVISSTGETICYSGDPGIIGNTTVASGGDNIITYKWQANGIDIGSSNSATYDPPAGLITTTTYTRFAKDGTCYAFTLSSGSWTVNVNNGPSGLWTGLISSDWFDCLNWAKELPTFKDDVVIPSGAPRMPIINNAGTAAAHDLIINSGATLTMTSGSNLEISRDWKNSGTFVPGTGTVIFNGSTGGQIQLINSGIKLNETFYNLTLSTTNGAKGISVDNGFELTVANNILLSSGDLRLNGEAQLVQNGTAPNPAGGSGKLLRDQQGTKSSFNYNYWSSPVSTNNATYTVGDILKDGTDSAVDAFATPSITFGDGATFADGILTSPIRISNRWIYKYTQSGTSYFLWQYIGSTGSIKVGEGFTMKGVTGSVPITDYQNYVFYGKPNNGDITLNIALNQTYLIGNPYPSALDADGFIRDNIADGGNASSNVFNGALYFWDHFGGQSHYLSEYVGGYATYTLMGGVVAISNDPLINNNNATGTKIPRRYIAVGQGFFIRTDTPGAGGLISPITGGGVVFKNSQRAFKTESSANSVFIRNSNPTAEVDIDNRQKIRLSFESPSGLKRQLLLGVDSSTGNGFDIGYDALMADLSNEDMYWYFSDTKFVIQAVNNFNPEQIIPIGLKITTAGKSKIKIDDLENISSVTEIYLFDSTTGMYYNLRNSDFEASLPIGEYNNRFSLRFTDTALGDNNSVQLNGLEIFVDANNIINIKNNSNNLIVKEVTFFNILGQSVKKWNVTNQTQSSILLDVQNVPSGVYIVNLKTSDGVLSRKVLIK